MSSEMPAAMVQSAAAPHQRLLVATVSTLAERAKEEGLGSPALVMVGAVIDAASVQAAARRFQSRTSGEPPLRRAFALIDNGSLAPASVLNLRRVAAELGALTGVPIDPVSWKHSGRIPASELEGVPASTIAPWLRSQRERGVTDFRFIPFFISPQGAIGSALRRDLEALTAEHGGSFEFTGSLTAAIPAIVAARIRESLPDPRRPVIVVDHGGPSPESAALRNRLASEVAGLLGADVASVTAASMESPDGAEFAFNRPLLAEALTALAAAGATAVVIAPLFLSRAGTPVRMATSLALRAPPLRTFSVTLPPWWARIRLPSPPLPLRLKLPFLGI